MKNQTYYIGVDGGGTKTAFGLFDEDGNCLKQVIKPTCHFLQVGFEGCAKCLKEGIEELISISQPYLPNLKIGIGIAGYGNDLHVKQQLTYYIDKALNGYDYTLTSDIHITILGALNGQNGIAVIAGTGAIAMANLNFELIRCGGWGYQLGDEGSAYWIGKQLLNRFCYQADGRDEKTILYDAIMDHFQFSNPYELISKYHNFENERTTVAQLSKLCSTLASQGDLTCQNILIEASKHIVNLVKGLKGYFEDQPLVTFYGGVFNKDLFKQTFCQELQECTIIEPQYDAMYGAYQFVKEN